MHLSLTDFHDVCGFAPLAAALKAGDTVVSLEGGKSFVLTPLQVQCSFTHNVYPLRFTITTPRLQLPPSTTHLSSTWSKCGIPSTRHRELECRSMTHMKPSLSVFESFNMSSIEGNNGLS